MKKKSITSFIQNFRIQQIKSKINRVLVGLINISIIYILIFGILESVFYFNTSIRISIVILFLFILLSIFIYIFLYWILHSKSFFNNSSSYLLAKKYGEQNPNIGDKLLNALQLEKLINKLDKNKDLAKYAIVTINNKLQKLHINTLYDPISTFQKKILTSTILISLLIIAIFFNTIPNAMLRIVQPYNEFPIPLPFSITTLNGNQEILGGDTLTISIAGYGELPDSINLILKDSTKSNIISISMIDEVYQYTFEGITKNTQYWAEYNSPTWLSPWEKISTKPYTISVIERPVIKDLGFNIIPPNYTNEKEFKHPGNITNISIPEGSHIYIQGETSKKLNSSWVYFNDLKHTLIVKKNKFEGSLYINNNVTISVNIEDENGIQNLYPSNYNFSIIKDYSPEIIIQNPKRKFELDESNIIYFEIQISDDYGFSDAWIEYRIKAPEYILQDSSLHTHKIIEILTDIKSQQLYHEWDISKFSLAPEDELHIQIVIADNNTLSGPSLTYSPILIGRYPSLEDLFNRMEEDENEIVEYGDEIQMNLEDVQELVEELELELLKSENVTWEQEQKTTEVLEKMDEVFNQIEQIQKTMDKIQEQADKNNLVSDNLIEKFSQFQELLDNIMTPEMLEAMEKLQESMKEIDPQKMLDALEDFEFDVSAFEEQLDRFIEMFELALAEQKMDEVIKRLEQLTTEQDEIIKGLKENDQINKLASRERRQEENFKLLQKVMNDAADAMEMLSPEAAQQLLNLTNSELTESTASDLKNARTNMQIQNIPSASQSAAQASSGLNEMLEIAQNIQNHFQQDTVDEMLRKFLALIQNLLYISQQQELLIDQTQGLRSRSPKIIETAIKQDKIQRETQQFMIQLTELSRETFHISPEIASAIGKTKVAMDKTISHLEQKQTTSAKKTMKNILIGLNEIGDLLLESTNQMQMSGSGSGMAEFMEQMEQMSQQQQGINQGTMNLPQMGMMAQQEMMEQLQKQQEKLKQQLEELLGENPGQENSGAGKARDDMEEVIEDFRRKQVDRRTQERQQRILSRMLDSQKSLTQKDYSEKRKSTSADEFIYSGPTGMPNDMGEREILIINAMESALKEGHSKEYQKMMKQYFRELQKNEK